jgi:hypothetical protein
MLWIILSLIQAGRFMGEVRSITAGRGAADIPDAHEALRERLRAATGGAEQDVLNKFATDLEN